MDILGVTMLGVLSSVEMLGEELGWLGWLFPHPPLGLCDLFLSKSAVTGISHLSDKKEFITVSCGGGTGGYSEFMTIE